MNEDELYYLVCQHPALAAQAIAGWLKNNELTDEFVKRFRFALQNGTLSAVDAIPTKYFVMYPELFRKEWWIKTKMHYDALENKEFQKLAELEDKDLLYIAMKCVPAYGDCDITDTDMEFLQRNVDAEWMQLLVMRMNFEVIMNYRLEYGFAFTSTGLKRIDSVAEYLEIDKRVGSMMIHDVLASGGELDFTDFLTYGLDPAGLAKRFVEENGHVNFRGVNCFSLPRLFDLLPRNLWAQGVYWLENNGVLTKPLLESLFEDVEFSASDKQACAALFTKYGCTVDTEDDSGLD